MDFLKHNSRRLSPNNSVLRTRGLVRGRVCAGVLGRVRCIKKKEEERARVGGRRLCAGVGVEWVLSKVKA